MLRALILKNVSGHIFFLFLSLWLVNPEKEVQFECSDDGEDLCLPGFSCGNSRLGTHGRIYLSWLSGESVGVLAVSD